MDYSTKSIGKQFFNLSFQNGLTPLINQPTKVSQTSATCIDQILTNSFMDSEIMSGIIKTDISDHFTIFCTIKANEKYYSNNAMFFKRDINKDTISDLEHLWKNIAWTDVLFNECASEVYDSFFSKFTDLCNIAFLNKKVKIKTKNLVSPWITKGLVKYSKRKQNLNGKLFRKRIYENRN